MLCSPPLTLPLPCILRLLAQRRLMWIARNVRRNRLTLQAFGKVIGLVDKPVDQSKEGRRLLKPSG